MNGCYGVVKGSHDHRRALPICRKRSLATGENTIDGYQLVNKINSTRDKLLVGADQVS